MAERLQGIERLRLLEKVEEKLKKEDIKKEKEKKKKEKESYKTYKKIIPKDLKKPKAKLPSYSPSKVFMKGVNENSSKLVREGKTGWFKDEYEKETKWLS